VITAPLTMDGRVIIIAVEYPIVLTKPGLEGLHPGCMKSHRVEPMHQACKVIIDYMSLKIVSL